jgi:hypothetical protein
MISHLLSFLLHESCTSQSQDGSRVGISFISLVAKLDIEGKRRSEETALSLEHTDNCIKEIYHCLPLISMCKHTHSDCTHLLIMIENNFPLSSSETCSIYGSHKRYGLVHLSLVLCRFEQNHTHIFSRPPPPNDIQLHQREHSERAKMQKSEDKTDLCIKFYILVLPYEGKANESERRFSLYYHSFGNGVVVGWWNLIDNLRNQRERG